MTHRIKKFTVYYLYFAAIFGGVSWGGYFVWDYFDVEYKEASAEIQMYKK